MASSEPRRGLRITCATCGEFKKPVGRDLPAHGGTWCHPKYDGPDGEGCDGYYEYPQPDNLWPGEADWREEE